MYKSDMKTIALLGIAALIGFGGGCTSSPKPLGPMATMAAHESAFAHAEAAFERYNAASEAALDTRIPESVRRAWAEKAIEIAWTLPALGGWERFSRLCVIAGGRTAMLSVAIRSITEIND